MPKRVQISTNIDPEIKRRLEVLEGRTGWTFRKTLEEALKIGIVQLEKLQDAAEKAKEKVWRDG